MCKALHLPNGWKCICSLTAIQNFVISLILFSFQPLSGAYHELAGSYTSNNPNEVRAVATKNEETFRTVSSCVSWSIDLWTVLSIYWDVFLLTGQQCWPGQASCQLTIQEKHTQTYKGTVLI